MTKTLANIVTRTHDGLPFHFRVDGWLNATKAAKHYEKDLSNFWKSVVTVEYLIHLCCELSAKSVESTDFAEKINGIKGLGPLLAHLNSYHKGYLKGTPSLSKWDVDRMKALVSCTSRGNAGGTWLHPDLVVFFARWLDPKFAVFCDAVIHDLIGGKAELVITKPTESAAMALPSDYLTALKALVVAEEERQKLTAEKAELDSVVDSKIRPCCTIIAFPVLG